MIAIVEGQVLLNRQVLLRQASIQTTYAPSSQSPTCVAPKHNFQVRFLRQNSIRSPYFDTSMHSRGASAQTSPYLLLTLPSTFPPCPNVKTLRPGFPGRLPAKAPPERSSKQMVKGRNDNSRSFPTKATKCADCVSGTRRLSTTGFLPASRNSPPSPPGPRRGGRGGRPRAPSWDAAPLGYYLSLTLAFSLLVVSS